MEWLRKKSEEKVADFGAQYFPFGLFGVVNYPVSFFVLYYLGGQLYESLLPRLFATVLCIPLLLKDKIPDRLVRWLPLYWHGVLLYCVPVFATYMLMKNHFSIEWLMNIFLGIFWLILLVDWATFACLIIMGVLLGSFWYFAVYGVIPTPDEVAQPYVIFALSLYCYAILIGIMFARNKFVFDTEKLRTLQTFGSTVAHEMRRPLEMIRRMTRELSHLIQKYAGGNKPLEPVDGEYMGEFVDDLAILTDRASYSVDIILSNVAENLDQRSMAVLSMSRSIADAVASYPLVGDEEEHITILKGSDFTFRGNGDLVRQIFFNLIQNSLQFINETGKGVITIEPKAGPGGHQVIFTDTSVGVRPSFLPKIFDPFESDHPHGTGIGLSFCRRAMDAMGGTITCDSVLGEYTTFTLTFPPVGR